MLEVVVVVGDEDAHEGEQGHAHRLSLGQGEECRATGASRVRHSGEEARVRVRGLRGGDVRWELVVVEDLGLLLFELVVVAHAKGHQEQIKLVLRQSEPCRGKKGG